MKIFAHSFVFRLAFLLPLAPFSCVTNPAPPKVQSQASEKQVDRLAGDRWESLEKERALDLIIEETRREGGMTYDVKHLKKVDVGESAFAVSLRGGEVLDAKVSAQEFDAALQKMLQSHADDCWERGYLLGTWIDRKAGTIAIDRTVLFRFGEEDRAKALNQALALGKKEQQKAIFDLSTGESIFIP